MNKKNTFKRTPYYWGIQSLCFMLVVVFMTSCATAGDKMKMKEGMEMKHEQEMEKEITYGSPFSPRVITEDMTCPVCNMYPARNTQFQSQLVFKDGSFVAFDGTKDLFKYLLNMEGYDKKHTKDDVAVTWVKDFNSGKWMDAKDAYFIIGSDVFGPMGRELIPFSDHMAAMAFKEEHGGGPIHYAEITKEVTDSLDKGEVKMGEHKHKMDMKEGMKMKKEHKMEEHEMEMKHK